MYAVQGHCYMERGMMYSLDLGSRRPWQCLCLLQKEATKAKNISLKRSRSLTTVAR